MLTFLLLVHYFLYIIFIPYNDYCNCISPTTESINCSISHKRKILLFYLQKKQKIYINI